MLKTLLAVDKLLDKPQRFVHGKGAVEVNDTFGYKAIKRILNYAIKSLRKNPKKN